jgi:hypothetical protein
MIRLFYIFLFAMSTPVFQGQGSYNLEKVFLDLKYTKDIRTLFDAIEKDPRFKLKTTRENFVQSAEFYAKYIGKTDICTNTDSIIVHIVTCNDMGTFFKPGSSNCKAIKVLYYLKDASAVNTNYQKLNKTIYNAITSDNPDWKNHEGASGGAYFLTDKTYPFITVDKHTYKKNYLAVEYANYDK